MQSGQTVRGVIDGKPRKFARAEYEIAGTAHPAVRLWDSSTASAAVAYAKAFGLDCGQNVLVRAIAQPEGAELYQVTSRGLKRLNPGGVK